MRFPLIVLLLACSLNSLSQTDSDSIPPYDLRATAREIFYLSQRNTDSALLLVQKYLEIARAENWVVGEANMIAQEAYVYSDAGEKLKMDNQFNVLFEYINQHKNSLPANEQEKLSIIMGKAYSHIGNRFRRAGDDSNALLFLEKSRVIFQGMENEQSAKALTRLNSIQAVILFNQGKTDEAAKIFKNSLEIYKQYKDSISIADMYGNIGSAYMAGGNVPLALEYFFKQLNWVKKIKNKDLIVSSLGAIGQVYYQQEEYRSSINYLQQSIKVSETMENKDPVSSNYIDLADAYKKLLKLDSAILYYNKALQYYKGQEALANQPYVLERIATVLILQKEWEQALKLVNEGLSIQQQFGLAKEAIWLNISKMQALLALKRPLEALAPAQLVAESVAEIEDILLQESAYGAIHQVYKANKQTNQAYEYLLKYLTITDSINSDEKAKEIARVEYEQQTKLLEAEQAKKELILQQEIEKQKILQYSAIGGGFLILIIALIIYRSYRIKQADNTKLEHQAEVLALKNEELQVMREKEQELMQKERELMEESISSKERQLATTTMLSHEKNSLLNQLQAQLQKIKENVADEGLIELKEASKMIQSNLNLQNSWESFVYQFENVHPKFFKAIRENHPSITPAELKIAAYIKIGFDNKQIAQVAGITLSAVKKGIGRLKKRMEVGAEESIREYIAHF